MTTAQLRTTSLVAASLGELGRHLEVGWGYVLDAITGRLQVVEEDTRQARGPIMLIVLWAIIATTAGAVPNICLAGNAGEPSSDSVRHSIRRPPSPAPPSKVDHSGRKRVGKASFYAKKFAGQQMADGSKMNPHGNNAASKTLPLGTKARVKNLETGDSAVVNIKDRGPYVKGRIIDLSPSTAEKIGISREEGVGKVEVAPIAVPQPDGSVKPGAAVREATADKAPAGKDRGP